MINSKQNKKLLALRFHSIHSFVWRLELLLTIKPKITTKRFFLHLISDQYSARNSCNPAEMEYYIVMTLYTFSWFTELNPYCYEMLFALNHKMHVIPSNQMSYSQKVFALKYILYATLNGLATQVHFSQ